MALIDLYYYLIKALFFFGLLRSFLKFDVLKDHYLFLAVLYTAGLAFLYWVYFMSWNPAADWRATEIWLGKTLVLSALYFWLLGKYDEGFLFWILVLAGPVFFIWF
jgi:hypothetical protein